MVNQKPSNYILRSLFLGIVTAIIYSYSAMFEPIYILLLYYEINSFFLFPLWMFIMIFFQLIIHGNFPYAKLFSMFIITASGVILAYYFPIQSAFELELNHISITAIIIGICTGWYNSSELKKRESSYLSHPEFPDQKRINRYKSISFVLIMYLVILLFMAGFNFDTQFLDDFLFDPLAWTTIIVSTLILSIFLLFDFRLLKAFSLSFKIGLQIFLFMFIYGQFIPQLKYRRAYDYEEFVFQTVLEINHVIPINRYSISILMLILSVIIYQIGALILEFPYLIDEKVLAKRNKRRIARKAKRSKRRQQRRIRRKQVQMMHTHSPKEIELPLPLETEEINTYTNLDKSSSIKALKKKPIVEGSRSSVIREKLPKSKRMKKARFNQPTNSYNPQYYELSGPNFNEPSKKKKKFRLNIKRIQDLAIKVPEEQDLLEISQKHEINLHYALNGPWLSEKFFGILLTALYIWISLFVMNSNNWKITSYLNIPLGLITLLSITWLFFGFRISNIKQIFQVSNFPSHLLLFVSVIFLNLFISMVFPNIVLFFIIFELYFFIPYFLIILRKIQTGILYIASPIYNVVQVLKYGLWLILTLQILLFGYKPVFSTSILIVFYSLSIAFYLLKIDKQNQLSPIIFELICGLGLTVLYISFNYQLNYGNTGSFIVSLLSIPFILLSFTLYHFIYMKVKYDSQHSFALLSEDAQNIIAKRIELRIKKGQETKIEELEHQFPEKFAETESFSPSNKNDEFASPSYSAENGNSSPNTLYDNPEKQLEVLNTLYKEEEYVEMLCPICHVEIPLGHEEIFILKSQKFIYCPNCREKVSVNEIFEPSYNTLILEHRKMLKNVIEQETTSKSKNKDIPAI